MFEVPQWLTQAKIYGTIQIGEVGDRPNIPAKLNSDTMRRSPRIAGQIGGPSCVFAEWHERSRQFSSNLAETRLEALYSKLLIIVIGSYDPCRNTSGEHGIGNVSNDAGGSPYNRVLAYSFSRDNSRAGPDESESPNFHLACNRTSGRDMGALSNPTLVINGGMGVDYGKIIYPSFRIDDCSRHHGDSAAQLRTHRNYCRGADCVHNLKPYLLEITAHLQAASIASDPHKRMPDPFVAKS